MVPTWAEIRVALRTLRRSKAFATFSILALALAIAANTTMSSLIDAIVHPDVTFPHPERLVVARFHGSPWYVGPRMTAAPVGGINQVLGASGRTYSAAGAWLDDDRTTDVSIQAGDQHLHVAMAYVGPGFFRTVGAHPLHGTLPYDTTSASRHLAVISESLWRRISGGVKSFAPFEITALYPAGSADYTVVGVLPRNGAPPLSAGLYLPEPNWYFDAALLRLRPGVTRAEALV